MGVILPGALPLFPVSDITVSAGSVHMTLVMTRSIGCGRGRGRVAIRARDSGNGVPALVRHAVAWRRGKMLLGPSVRVAIRWRDTRNLNTWRV